MRSRAPAALAPMIIASALFGCGDGPTGSSTDIDAPVWSCSGGVEGGNRNHVVVKNGRTCDLNGVEVRGNIQVEEGASLLLIGGTVRGNVQADEAGSVQIRDVLVEGNIQIQESASAIVADAIVHGDIQVTKVRNLFDGVVLVTGNDVLNGNIQVEENEVLTLEISGNLIRKGNLQVMKNRGSGAKLVVENTVSQNLQCKENTQPFTAADNDAGDRDGQCS